MSVGALVTSAPPADPKAAIRLCLLCFKPVKGGVPGVSSLLVEEHALHLDCGTGRGPPRRP